MAGAHLFLSLESELKKRGAIFRIVEARSTVRDMLRLEGMEERVGRIDRFTTPGRSDRRFPETAGEEGSETQPAKPESPRT